MVRSTMSIMGLYNYDNSLFDNMVLPADLDRDTVIDNLLIELEGLEVLYPNAMTMKVAIGAWSKARVESWTKMTNALRAEYNAIHNFDRKEDYVDIVKQNAKSNGTTSGRHDDEATNLVSGYNTSDGLTPSQKGEGKGTTLSTSEGQSQQDRVLDHKAHLYGNIGVTTTQEMIEAELNLRKADIYHLIIEEFKDKFCLLVY